MNKLKGGTKNKNVIADEEFKIDQFLPKNSDFISFDEQT